MMLLKRIILLLVIQLVTITCCAIQAQTFNQEAAFLQTDRSVYIAGETLYYKLDILDADTKKHSERSKVGYIVLRSFNLLPTLKIRVKIDAGMAYGSIVLPETLLSGVYQFVGFTAAMKNYGEECFFHKDVVIANRFDKELQFKIVQPDSNVNNKIKFTELKPEIKTDKSIYGVREKVSVSLSRINSKGNVVVSVYEDSKIPESYNLFVENLKQLKLFPTDKKVVTSYLFENKAKIMRGSVVDVSTDKCIPNAVVLLSCIDTIPDLQYASTNSTGMFQMLLPDYYNGKELFLTIKDVPAGQHWKIKIEDEFALTEQWTPSLFHDNFNNKEYLLKSQNIVYIDKSYPLKKVFREDPLNRTGFICPQFYHCSVRSLYPDDFVTLDDFPEIVVELLPQINISMVKSKYVARIFNNTTKMYFNNEPAIFLDGVYVDDINKIIGLGSEQIKRIDVIDTERIFGDLVFPGVISILSKTNEIRNTKPANQSLRIMNDFEHTGEKFVPINPNAILNKNIPYFKQLLYWNPDMKMNGTDTTDFEFYTSDNTANYIIEINGFTEDGIPICTSRSIEVNNQINNSEK